MKLDYEYKRSVVKHDIVVSILSKFSSEKNTSKRYDYLVGVLESVYSDGAKNNLFIGFSAGVLVGLFFALILCFASQY